MSLHEEVDFILFTRNTMTRKHHHHHQNHHDHHHNEDHHDHCDHLDNHVKDIHKERLKKKVAAGHGGKVDDGDGDG